MNAVEKSQELLRNQLGDIDYTKFINRSPVTYEGKEGIMMVHLREGRVDVARTIGDATQRGHIIEESPEELFDATAAFIANSKNGRIDWGCGRMGVKFPNEMPPRDLSFITWLSSMRLGFAVVDQLKDVVKTLLNLTMFPYYLGNYAGESEDRGIGVISYFLMSGFMPIMMVGISMGNLDAPLPPIINASQLMILIGYLWLPFVIGLIHGSYKRWKGKWEVKKE